MRCDRCDHEQDGGSFCGRCGAFLGQRGEATGTKTTGAEATSADPSPSGPVQLAAPPPAAATAWGRRWAMPVGLAVVVAVGMLTQLFGDGSAAPPPATGDRLFDGWTDTVVVLARDHENTALLDLDTGTVQPVDLPGSSTGEDGMMMVHRVGERLVIGGSSLWLVEPGTDHSLDLGPAMPVRAADPDRLWLLDGRSPGADGQGTPPTLRLIDAHGELLHEVEPDDPFFPLAGVPGGLAGRTEGGLTIYRTDDGGFVDGLLPEQALVAAASRERIVWCVDPCTDLLVSDAAGDLVVTVGEDTATYDPGQVWLSDDGRYLAAASQPLDGDQGGFEMQVYDVDTGGLLDRTDVSLTRYDGDWTADGEQFLFLSPRVATRELQRYVVDEGFTSGELPGRRMPLAGIVTLPRGAVDWSSWARDQPSSGPRAP